MATVRIPTPLRNLCGGASEVAVDGSTVEEVLKNLEAAQATAKDAGMRVGVMSDLAVGVSRVKRANRRRFESCAKRPATLRAA